MAKEKVRTKYWKPGQLVTLGEKRHVYRIVHAATADLCSMCRWNNKSVPCADIFEYYKNVDHIFSINKCIRNMPTDCYPKRL